MRRYCAILFFSANCGHAALAMNWEGHDDDWVYDIPHGQIFELAVPEARPLPSPDCPVTNDEARTNAYEQIPLPRHNCKSIPAGQPAR